MDIIGKRKIYYLISLLFIIPGILSILVFGLKLSPDFIGGSRMTILFGSEVGEKEITFLNTTFEDKNIKVISIEPSDKLAIVRIPAIDEKQNSEITKIINEEYKDATQEEFSTIGPVIGRETMENAIKAIIFASILVVVYITFVFRKVPKPASSIRFGVTTVIALVHDVLVVFGVFAILGYLFNVELDALFVTAILTVIGFSVHDTIVVFDRIRENLNKNVDDSFAKVVNDSILQTITRSLNTSVTVLFILFAMLIFGGESIRWFIVALTVGIISGTYSSIFTASPILVDWHEWSLKRSKNKKSPASTSLTGRAKNKILK